MIQTIHEFCPKETSTAKSIQEFSGGIYESILAEAKTQEEVSVIRGKRQRQCLLEKRIVEIQDFHLEEQMLKLIDSSIAGMKQYALHS